MRGLDEGWIDCLIDAIVVHEVDGEVERPSRLTKRQLLAPRRPSRPAGEDRNRRLLETRSFRIGPLSHATRPSLGGISLGSRWNNINNLQI